MSLLFYFEKAELIKPSNLRYYNGIFTAPEAEEYYIKKPPPDKTRTKDPPIPLKTFDPAPLKKALDPSY